MCSSDLWTTSNHVTGGKEVSRQSGAGRYYVLFYGMESDNYSFKYTCTNWSGETTTTVTSVKPADEAAKNATDMMDGTRETIQAGVKLTADTASSLEAISVVSDQISAISDHLVTAVHGQESALAIMEERISAISTIADQNLQNAGGMKQSSGMLEKEAEALRSQVVKFNLKEVRSR